MGLLGARKAVQLYKPAAASGGSTATLSSESMYDFADIFSRATVSTDTGSGTYYAVVIPSASAAPSGAQIEAGTDGNGNAAAATGSATITGTGQNQVECRGFTANTAYKMYITHKVGSNYSNVVNLTFTSDVSITSDAVNGTAGSLTASTGSAAFTGTISDAYGGSNAIRWVDNGDALTNQTVVAARNSVTFFSGVNKFHCDFKHNGGAAHVRLGTANVTVTGNANFNISTGAVGTEAWTGTPIIYSLGSGWYRISGELDMTGADVSGSLNINKALADNVVNTITRDGTHSCDLCQLRITRVA